MDDKTKKVLKIDKKHLDSEMSRQPSRIASWSENLAEMEETVEKAKGRLKLLEDSYYIAYRKKYLGKKISSETYIKAKVNKNAKVQKEQRNLMHLSKLVSIAKGRMKALTTKSDMMINIGYNQRKELEQGIVRQKEKHKRKTE